MRPKDPSSCNVKQHFYVSEFWAHFDQILNSIGPSHTAGEILGLLHALRRECGPEAVEQPQPEHECAICSESPEEHVRTGTPFIEKAHPRTARLAIVATIKAEVERRHKQLCADMGGVCSETDILEDLLFYLERLVESPAPECSDCAVVAHHNYPGPECEVCDKKEPVMALILGLKEWIFDHRANDKVNTRKLLAYIDTLPVSGRFQILDAEIDIDLDEGYRVAVLPRDTDVPVWTPVKVVFEVKEDG